MNPPSAPPQKALGIQKRAWVSNGRASLANPYRPLGLLLVLLLVLLLGLLLGLRLGLLLGLMAGVIRTT